MVGTHADRLGDVHDNIVLLMTQGDNWHGGHGDVEEEDWDEAPSVHQGQERQDRHGAAGGCGEQAHLEHEEVVLGPLGLDPVQGVLAVGLDLLGQLLGAQ